MAAHEPAFDPYLKWLGIRPKDQPPHHYRLLGVEAFESDADVIANAADARMLHVKTFQSGPYSQLSQRLLNEIATAKVCLLNPAKKAEYDRRLREQLAVSSPQPATSAATAMPPALPQAPHPTPSPSQPDESAVANRRPTNGIVIAVGVAVAVVLAALAASLLRRGSPELAQEDPSPAVAQPQSPLQQETPETARSSEVAKPQPSPEKVEPSPPKPTPTDSTDPGAESPRPEPQPPAVVTPEMEPLPKATEQAKEEAEAEEPMIPGELMPGKRRGPPHNRAPAATVRAPRLAVPDESEQKAAEKSVRSDFQSDIGRAKNRDLRLGLGRKLFAQAALAKQPAERYALLSMACETFAMAGELPRAFEALDEIAKLYEVDPADEKVALLSRVIESAKIPPAALANNLEFMEAILLLTDSALIAGHPGTAEAGIETLRLLAKKTRSQDLNKLAALRAESLQQLVQDKDAVAAAEKALAADPASPEANLSVGRWACLVDGDWAKGLPCLGKCGDSAWAALAEAEQTEPSDVAERVALATAWARQAEQISERWKPRAAARAQHWLDRARPGLQDFPAARPGAFDPSGTQRLAAQIAAWLPPKLGTQGARHAGNVAAAANGATVSSSNGSDTGLNDNRIPPLMGQPGIASARWPCQWTLTFPEVYCLRDVYIKFPDMKNSIHTFTLEASPDGVAFHPLIARRAGQGWVRLHFYPRPVKALRLQGISQTGGSTFYVSELEAYTDSPPLRAD